MHRFHRPQYRLLLCEAHKVARESPGRKICGLLIDTGHHLSFVQARNVSPKAGSFQFSRGTMLRRIRLLQLPARTLQQKDRGARFHSHPMAAATPGPSDIKHAVDDSLMFIFD